MADLQAFKISATNHLPDTGNARFPVYSKQFNDLVQKTQDDLTSIEDQLDGLSLKKKSSSFSVDITAEGATTSSVSDSDIEAGDQVQAIITDFTGVHGTDGLPYVAEATTNDGSVDFEVANAHSANAVSSSETITIGYTIIKG